MTNPDKAINSPLTQLLLGAAESNDWESAKGFIEEGALTNAVDNNGNTAIMLFAKAGNGSVAALELARIMTATDIVISNNDGETVTSIFVKQRHLSALWELAEIHPFILSESRILDDAARNKNVALLKELLEMGFQRSPNFDDLVQGMGESL